MHTAIALASPNIAFIKYWGNRDQILRIPANGSISMNLSGLYTHTQVSFDSALRGDRLTLNGKTTTGPALARVSAFLDHIRDLADLTVSAYIESRNNFPTAAGIASSASAFASLALAASKAAGIELEEKDLSRLARKGSGSACRSVPAGFVEWFPGQSDADSYAVSIASCDHWDLVDCIAVISTTHKPKGSTEGHMLAGTSPLQSARVADAPRRLDICRQAILSRDFEALSSIMELDSNLMHAVMLTSSPPLIYWLPGTLSVMHAVQEYRSQGLPVCYTIDAGPNVHVICQATYQDQVTQRLKQINAVREVIVASTGGAAHLVPEQDNP